MKQRSERTICNKKTGAAGRAMRLAAGVIGIAMLAIAVPAAPAQAVEVRADHKGMGLLGEAVFAPNKTWKDGVVVMVHGTMAHSGQETMKQLQATLRQQGVSSLAVTLSLNVSDRRGVADFSLPQTHRLQDAAGEIVAWVDWLKGQGAGDVTVLGFSRGGNQVMRYGTGKIDPAVKRIVLLAPLTWDEKRVRDGYEMAHNAPLPARLADAEKLVAAGKGSEMMRGIGFLNCPDAAVRADTFVSYYRDDGEMDSPQFFSKIRTPVLVVAGTVDMVVPDLAGRVKQEKNPNVRTAIVDGADHFFTDIVSDDAAAVIAKFVNGD
ncbi:MAG: alpha/beta fold hydrolase [Rhodospirillales bacterium]|nr:alpha/beta fold hydrolase [Rhodospirillales bacterium]